MVNPTIWRMWVSIAMSVFRGFVNGNNIHIQTLGVKSRRASRYLQPEQGVWKKTEWLETMQKLWKKYVFPRHQHDHPKMPAKRPWISRSWRIPLTFGTGPLKFGTSALLRCIQQVPKPARRNVATNKSHTTNSEDSRSKDFILNCQVSDWL